MLSSFGISLMAHDYNIRGGKLQNVLNRINWLCLTLTTSSLHSEGGSNTWACSCQNQSNSGTSITVRFFLTNTGVFSSWTLSGIRQIVCFRKYSSLMSEWLLIIKIHTKNNTNNTLKSLKWALMFLKVFYMIFSFFSQWHICPTAEHCRTKFFVRL